MVDDDIEFNFEEKFIFGHQNFVNCCFKVQFGCGAKSNCLIADRTGILYFPIISEDGDVRIRQVDLKDVSNKNLAIASIYRVDHKDHCYLFISCEAKDGGRYSLITYCLSNLDISQGDTELLSWQIMDFPFKIMDAEYLTDNSQNSIILLCGSDRRIHLYHIDAQCIIRRKKKNDFKITPLLEEMLVSSRDEDSFLLTALPIRLFINKNTTDHTVSDILLGYSNGILLSFHDSIEIQQPDNEIEFIQEIPSFHGTSTSTTSSANVSGKSSILKNTEQISIKSDLSAKRKSRNQSSDDLAKLLEELNEADENEEILEIGSKSNDFDVNFTIPLPSITEESIGSTIGNITGNTIGSTPKNKLQSEENVPQVIENNIEKNVLLFDGIVSCLCFYQIPLTLEITDDKLKYKNKNKNMSWIDPKPKKLNFMNCVVIGLASGSTLLVHFDDAEKPIEILPNYCHHGGVITMTQGYITNNDCQDIVSVILYSLFLLYFQNCIT